MKKVVDRLEEEGVRMMDKVLIVTLFILTVITLFMYFLNSNATKENTFVMLIVSFSSALISKFTNSFGKPYTKKTDSSNESTDS